MRPLMDCVQREGGAMMRGTRTPEEPEERREPPCSPHRYTLTRKLVHCASTETCFRSGRKGRQKAKPSTSKRNRWADALR